MIVSMAATTLTAQSWTPNWEPDSHHRTQILMIDISRAYFNAKTSDDDPIYVELPAEAEAPEGTCALLKRHMYGTRRAADGWQDEYSTRLREAGFTQGMASPCVFPPYAPDRCVGARRRLHRHRLQTGAGLV